MCVRPFIAELSLAQTSVTIEHIKVMQHLQLVFNVMRQWAGWEGWQFQQTCSIGLQLAAGHSSELQRGQALSVMQGALRSHSCS